MLTVTCFQVEISPVPFEDSDFFGNLVFLPINPVDFFEKPSFTKMCSDDCMLVAIIRGDKLVKKPKELVDLKFRKVGVVTGVFHFKSVNVLTFSCHNVWKRVEARIAYGNTNGIVAFFLQEFN